MSHLKAITKMATTAVSVVIPVSTHAASLCPLFGDNRRKRNMTESFVAQTLHIYMNWSAYSPW